MYNMSEEELFDICPILQLKWYKLTKQSIIDLAADNLSGDRANLILFFYNWAREDNDKFFEKMLCAVKFIDEGATAYTTPDKIIALNYPMDMVPQDKERWRRWYFIYCHECLHQLWETFKVGDTIKAKVGNYDHEILNIASDCVINDYLTHIIPNHKLPPIGGVTPEALEERYGIKFDRRIDTQYSMYLKLMKASEKERKEMKEKYGEKTPPHGPGGDPGTQKGPKGGGGGGQGPKGGGGGGQQEKHSDAWIEGWNKALEDYKNGKIKL